MIVLIENTLKMKSKERCTKCNTLITKRHNICNYCKGFLECKKDKCLKCEEYFKEWYFKQECLITDDD